MKKIIFSLSIIGLLGMTSCSEDDFLTHEPTNSEEFGDAITNENQLEGAVMGIYDGFQSPNAYGNFYISSQEMLSDNAFVLFDNSNRLTDFYRYQHALSSGGSISNMWTIGYRIIARANFVLSYEGQITGPNAAGSFAEARALRALALFNMVNYYARPYGTTNQELGIPIPYDFDKDAQIPRSSVAEVYDEIISQFELALPDLTSTNKARLNANAVYGLLSRVYLYKKDYVNAAQYAELALNNLGGEMLSGADLEDYYLDPTAYDETLFAIDFTALDNPGANDALFATWTTGGRYEDTAATSEFYNLIADTDARKGLYEVWETSDNPLPYGVKKFGGIDNDVVVIRASEVALNKIEALYFTNPSLALSELVSWIQTYRDASYTFSGTGQALLDEILNQRRIELAFEGHRYFDMNRYQLDVQKGENCAINCNMPFSDYRRVFPIPLNEMNTNSAMVQNPQYQ